MQLRRSFLAGALLAPMLCVGAAPAPSLAAGPGGAAGPSTPTSKSGGSKPSPTAPAKGGKVQVSLHVTTVRITRVSCTPSTRCSKNPRQVSLRGTLVVEGVGLAPNMVVAFPSAPGARISSVSPAARLRRSGNSLVVTVPSHAHSGRIKVLLSKHRYTSSFGPIYVFAHSIGPPAARLVVPSPANPSVFDGQGMWIWYMSASDKGSVTAIAEQAHAAGVTTLFIKSSDGSTNYWSQFSAQLVGELHAVGLKVCGWQYVYGSNPAGEAALGAEAVANGAECLVIDAEAEYEGHYAAAQTYLTDLRAKIGSAYPLGLASFPYVNYHPTFPYSVFLGPEGAQFNLPQMYWKDIGAVGRHRVRQHLHRQPRVRAPDLPPRADLRRRLQLRPAALPRGGRRLRRHGLLLLGLAGDPRLGLDHAGRAADAADQRHAQHQLPGTAPAAARATRCCGCRSTSRARSPPRKPPASSAARPWPTWRASRPATGSPPAGSWKPPPGRRC